MSSSILKAALWASTALGVASASLPIQLETRGDLTSHLANIHLTHREVVDGPVHFTYGSCLSESAEQADHTIGNHPVERASRLVWVIPQTAKKDGCISAWNESGSLVGRSERQKLHGIRRRALKRDTTGIPMTNQSGIDPLGPWFDGVELLSQKEPAPVDVEAAKSKNIAIVGAGMAGLMTYLVLTQAGFTNVSLVEADSRIGGRVRTAYLTGGPFDYSYQEMGPMRFPATYFDPVGNQTYEIKDHKLVFDLADEMNRINGDDESLKVEFINWIQSNLNSLSYYNEFKLDSGLPPTLAQIRADPTLGAPAGALDDETIALNAQLMEALSVTDVFVDIAENMFKAHREWIDSGLGGLHGEQWSEFAYLVNYLGGSLNSTDMLGGSAQSYWETLYEGFFFSSATWKTIDGGLSRLPASMLPLVEDDLTLGREIERIRYADDKVTLQWKEDGALQSSEHDYAVISAPFSVVRRWRLPQLNPTMRNAITKYSYGQACKIALEYSERFWEHYENPIFGGCSTASDIPGFSGICYPSYNLNGTGPATILASYVFGEFAISVGSLSEEEHVALAIEAMTEIHGEESRALYTGKYERVCWSQEPYAAMAYGTPRAGQHELYMPEYFKTHSNMIFIGEQTSVTQAWVASALESGVRGSVQLMLELGLIDEAKEAVNKWMARWIDV